MGEYLWCLLLGLNLVTMSMADTCEVTVKTGDLVEYGPYGEGEHGTSEGWPNDQLDSMTVTTHRGYLCSVYVCEHGIGDGVCNTYEVDASAADKTQGFDGLHAANHGVSSFSVTSVENLPTYDITISEFMCDNSLSLWQSDDRGVTWTQILSGVEVDTDGIGIPISHPAPADITVSGKTILRFGCWDYGGVGYFHGPNGLTVEGTTYPVAVDGLYEFIGWESTCEGFCDGGGDCLSDIPEADQSNLAGIIDPDVVAAEGPLVDWNGGVWPTARTGVDVTCGMAWFDFDFLDTVIGDDFYWCASPPDSINWDTLAADGTNIPVINYAITDNGDLSLSIHVELEYLGYATADGDEDNAYGTTYVLDFEDFNAHEDSITNPGSCQNRVADDFAGKDFAEWWQYSETPAAPGCLGDADYLAYPPPNDKWSISMKTGDDCNTVVYDGTFTWNDLVSCNDGSTGGDPYVVTDGSSSSITDGSPVIALDGVFYVNVVSPFQFDQDSTYYRVYQLLSQPFRIEISKSVYVKGEAGINVLTMSVIAVYKEEGMKTFKLVVLTESQNYLELIADSSGYTFTADGDPTIYTGDFTPPETDETGGTCLSNKAFICSQLWEIKAENVDCPSGGIDFSGEYLLAFNTQCRTSETAYTDYCDGWLGAHPDIASGVDLKAQLTWRDDVCDPELFEVQFEAAMTFYTDAGYTISGEEPHLFQVGDATVYVEIVTEFPGGTYSVFDSELKNVWICTFDPNDSVSDPDPDSASGGCFDDQRDGTTGDTDPYHIYSTDGTGLSEEGFASTGHPDGDDESKDQLRFSFVVPNKIARDTLYIHAQVEISLTPTRRRVLLNVGGTANQMRHFIGNIGVGKAPKERYRPQPPQEPQPQPREPINYPPQNVPYGNTWTVDLSSPWIVVIGSLLAVILSANIIFMCYYNCCNKQQRRRYSFNRRRRSGYSSVKDIDSEEFNDSEANAINVASD